MLEVDGKGKQISLFSSQPWNQEEEKNIFAYHDTFSVLFWISWDLSQIFSATEAREKSKYIRKPQSRGLLSHLWHSLAQVFLPKLTAMAFPVEGFRMIIPSRMPWEGNGFSAYV